MRYHALVRSSHSVIVMTYKSTSVKSSTISRLGQRFCEISCVLFTEHAHKYRILLLYCMNEL